MRATFAVPDVSEFQIPLSHEFSGPAVIVRAAFGPSREDRHFARSAAIAAEMWRAGRLRGGVVAYQVAVPTLGNAEEHFEFLWKTIGHDVPDWLTGVMIDVETWRDTDYEQSGDQSDFLNSLYSLNARKFNHWSACKGYFNAGDGAELWPRRDSRLEYTLAHYSSQLVRHSMSQVAQQYTNGSEKPVTPHKLPRVSPHKLPRVSPHRLPRVSPVFGPCDHNVFFDIADAAAFRGQWGRPMHPADATAKK